MRVLPRVSLSWHQVFKVLSNQQLSTPEFGNTLSNTLAFKLASMLGVTGQLRVGPRGDVNNASVLQCLKPRLPVRPCGGPSPNLIFS